MRNWEDIIMVNAPLDGLSKDEIRSTNGITLTVLAIRELTSAIREFNRSFNDWSQTSAHNV